MRSVPPTLLLVVGLLMAACADDARVAPTGLRVADAWARPTADTTRPSAVYLTLHNGSAAPDTLLTVRTTVARTVEMHRSATDADGVMRMRPVDHVVVPPHDSVALRPGGLHLMLVGLRQPLRAGEQVALVLAFARADTLRVDAVARR